MKEKKKLIELQQNNLENALIQNEKLFMNHLHSKISTKRVKKKLKNENIENMKFLLEKEQFDEMIMTMYELIKNETDSKIYIDND